MAFTRHSQIHGLLGALVFLLGCFAVHAAGAAEKPDRPKLVVVLVIDQFRGDYIPRFQPFFGPGGFNRLLNEGFDYNNCQYHSAITETGPGHATILTGAYAHQNGIAQNVWYDSAARQPVYCVEDTSHGLVWSEASEAMKIKSLVINPPVSPRNLLAGTVGDNLKPAYGGHSKVISLSIKDRAAILLGGHAADLAVWLDKTNGQFISSDYYVRKLPGWLDEFNRPKPADRWFKKMWELSLPPEQYAGRCTADNDPIESGGGYQTKNFPHQLGWNSAAPDENYYMQLYTCPFSNELLVDLALTAIEREKLGQRAVPDLLAVSFSANDPIGHAFGPDSWEVMDAAIKTDRALARLLKGLDAKVGKGNWTLFLTADHGVTNFPEELQAQRIDARRVSATQFQQALEQHLRATFGAAANKTDDIALIAMPWIALNPQWLAGMQPEARQRVIRETTTWLAARPAVAFAVATGDLAAQSATPDPLPRAVINSYYPGRSGEIAFALKPNYLFSDFTVGTSHGAAYRYDQYVALLACGCGIAHGRSSEPVSPLQIAPTAAILLGIVPPNLCEVDPLVRALDGAHD